MSDKSVRDFSEEQHLNPKALNNYITRNSNVLELGPSHVYGRPRMIDELAQAYIIKYYVEDRTSKEKDANTDFQSLEIIDIDGREVAVPQNAAAFLSSLVEQTKGLSIELGEANGKLASMERELEDYKNKLSKAEQDFLKHLNEQVPGPLYAKAQTEAEQYKNDLEKLKKEHEDFKVDKQILESRLKDLQAINTRNTLELKRLKATIEGIDYVTMFGFNRWKKQVKTILNNDDDTQA